MGKVFISYDHESKAFAEQIRLALEQRGVDFWIDVNNIPAGEKWRQAIDQGLEICLAMLLIITPEALASEHVSYEWHYAVSHNRLLIPLLYRDVPHIPDRLKDIQFISMRSPESRDAGINEIFDQLQANNILASNSLHELRATQAASLRALSEALPEHRRGEATDVVLPIVFKNEYHAYLTVIERRDHELIQQVYRLEKLDENLPSQLGDLHHRWATALWSSSSLPDQWRCAYHFRLAGFCYSRAEDFLRAGQQYILAGQQFSTLQVWHLAAEVFEQAAKEARRSEIVQGYALADRALKEARACYRRGGDDDRADDIGGEFP